MMQKPKLKLFLGFTLALGIESIIFSIATYNAWSLPWMLFSLLLGILGSLIYLLIDFYLQFLKFYKANNEVYKRHQALTLQFDQKNRILDKYEVAFNHLGHSVITAITILTKKEKSQVENLYSIYLKQLEIIEGEKNNGQ